LLKNTDIKKDFEIFKDRTLGILLFGSYAIGEETGASDMDVCLVKPQNDTVLKDYSFKGC
jgi:predicted nucleotidyltransferase